MGFQGFTILINIQSRRKRFVFCRQKLGNFFSAAVGLRPPTLSISVLATRVALSGYDRNALPQGYRTIPDRHDAPLPRVDGSRYGNPFSQLCRTQSAFISLYLPQRPRFLFAERPEGFRVRESVGHLLISLSTPPLINLSTPPPQWNAYNSTGSSQLLRSST